MKRVRYLSPIAKAETTARQRRLCLAGLCVLAMQGSLGLFVKPAAAASSGSLGFAQVEGYWVAAGGPASQAATAAAIAGAESSYEPGIIQSGQPYSTTGWGLWQITPGNSGGQFGQDYQLLDPWNNAEAAVAKYQNAGNSFSPWTTYNNGTYRAFLPSNPPAPVRVCDPGQYVPIGAAPTGTHNASQPGSDYGPSIPGCSLHVFWEGGDQNLWQDYSDQVWHGPNSLGSGPLGSPPHPVSSQPGVADVFWRGTGNDLFYDQYFGGTWSGPTNLTTGGPMSSEPYPASPGYNGQVHVFWQGRDGALWENWYDGSWHQQSHGSGPLGSGPHPVYSGNGIYDVFWRGNGNDLFHDWYTGGSWFGPANLTSGGPMASDPEPVSIGSGEIHVLWQSLSATLWQNWYDAGGWHSQSLPGSQVGSIPRAIYQ